MVALADIRRWKPAGLEDAFAQLGRARDELVGLQDELDASRNPDGWIGDAARAAGTEYDRIGEHIRRVIAGVSAVRAALAQRRGQCDDPSENVSPVGNRSLTTCRDGGEGLSRATTELRSHCG